MNEEKKRRAHIEFSDETLDALKESFSFIASQDSDIRNTYFNSTYIEKKQIKALLKTYGKNRDNEPTDKELDYLLELQDFNQNGVIDFGEFLTYMTGRAQEEEVMDPNEAEREAQSLFDMFDMDGDGVISENDLHEFMKSVDEDLSVEEVTKMMAEHLSSGEFEDEVEGMEFNEFKKLMSQTQRAK